MVLESVKTATVIFLVKHSNLTVTTATTATIAVAIILQLQEGSPK